MARKKKGSPPPAGAPAWMTTFSDMTTLLLTFFILLYSISSVDAQKFKAISNSLASALQGEGGPKIFDGQDPTPDIPGESDASGEDKIPENNEITPGILAMYQQVSGYVTTEQLEQKVSVSVSSSGVFVDIKDNILFESGKATLSQGGKEILNNLENLFLQFENEIVVEGHTDNVPTSSRKYPTNWELSTDRALTVVRYLSETKNVPSERLAAIGYGEFRPIAPNDNDANRAKNRRVNLLIIIEESGEK